MENNKETKKKSAYHIVIDQISGIFFPILSYLTAASIIKSVIVLLATFNVISEQGGLYQIFYAMSDGFFYFLPFALMLFTNVVELADNGILACTFYAGEIVCQ